MANDVVWDNIMLKEFRSLACLSEEEDLVLTDWAFGKSIVSTAMRCSMSDRKVKSIRKSIRMKYDNVCIYTPLLPERRIKM